MRGLATLILLMSSLAHAADAPISAAVAALYVGRSQVVEGKVESAQRFENTVRLRLGPTPQSLSVSLIIGLLSDFPPSAEEYYVGKNVRVSGTIESFRGVPEITLRDSDHIQVMEPVTTVAVAQPTASVDPEAARLRQQIEQLRTQLNGLESRLKQLEHESPKP